jgi:hypothetical protein
MGRNIIILYIRSKNHRKRHTISTQIGPTHFWLIRQTAFSQYESDDSSQWKHARLHISNNQSLDSQWHSNWWKFDVFLQIFHDIPRLLQQLHESRRNSQRTKTKPKSTQDIVKLKIERNRSIYHQACSATSKISTFTKRISQGTAEVSQRL